MGIRLATFQQHQLTAQDYALLCAKSVSSGIFYGCNVTIKDESTLHVTTGVGIANGRTFDVTDDDYPVELTGGGSMVGRIYVHVDLADVDTPAQILVVKGATLPPLVQDSDMNESTGVWDLELATFDVDASEISNLVYTASGVSGGGGGTMLAPYYDASEAWLKDQIFQKDGVLYKCLTDIAVGTPLVVDTNVKVTDFAEETEALNQNLMQRPIYNPTDDYLYGLKNGVWTKSAVKLGLNKTYVFQNGAWNTDFLREYDVPSLNYPYGSGTLPCTMTGDFTITNNTIAMTDLGHSNAKAVQVKIENRSKPIVVKYRTNPSSAITEQEIRFDTQLYDTSYLVLATGAWNGTSGVVQYKWIKIYSSAQTAQTITVESQFTENRYITEIYVDA